MSTNEKSIRRSFKRMAAAAERSAEACERTANASETMAASYLLNAASQQRHRFDNQYLPYYGVYACTDIAHKQYPKYPTAIPASTQLAHRPATNAHVDYSASRAMRPLPTPFLPLYSSEMQLPPLSRPSMQLQPIQTVPVYTTIYPTVSHTIPLTTLYPYQEILQDGQLLEPYLITDATAVPFANEPNLQSHSLSSCSTHFSYC